jgi:hypothetical protein
MRRLAKYAIASVFLLTIPAQSAFSAEAWSQPKKVAADPNQKVCEDITMVGSRLAKKRICATRAEWAEKRKQDRDTVDDAQRSAHIGCSVVNTHSSTPAC